MDPITIASTTISLLTPYLVETGGKVAKNVVGAAWEKLTEIYKTVKERLAQEKDGNSKEAFRLFENGPEKQEQSTQIQKKLVDVLTRDPAFAKKLEKMLKDADKVGAGTMFNINISGGKVEKIITVSETNGVVNIN
jgi:hypothetical protein